jgi:hypothetical protein
MSGGVGLGDRFGLVILVVAQCFEPERFFYPYVSGSLDPNFLNPDSTRLPAIGNKNNFLNTTLLQKVLIKATKYNWGPKAGNIQYTSGILRIIIFLHNFQKNREDPDP